MLLFLLLLLLAIVAFGVGFTVKWLFIVAIVLLILALINGGSLYRGGKLNFRRRR